MAKSFLIAVCIIIVIALIFFPLFISYKEQKNKKSKFVTKDTFQLVFGFSCPTIQAKCYYQEYNSKGSINGVRQV